MSAGTIILKMLPVVSETVRKMEEIDSTPNKGTQKAQLAMTILKGIYEAENPSPAVSFDQLTATLQTIISALVEFYKSVGVFFSHSAQTTTAA